MSATYGYEHPATPPEPRGLLRYPCPHCNAGVGERCRTSDGRRAALTHSARWPRARAGGETQPEPARGRQVVPARLGADARAALDALAARWGLTRSGAVERAVLEAAGVRRGPAASGRR